MVQIQTMNVPHNPLAFAILSLGIKLWGLNAEENECFSHVWKASVEGRKVLQKKKPKKEKKNRKKLE